MKMDIGLYNDMKSYAVKYILRCLVLHHRTKNLQKPLNMEEKRHNVYTV